MNSLQGFKQDGQRTLFEVTDKGGRSWKVGSVELPSLTTYFVISSDGRVDVIATAFEDRLHAKHAVVFADSTEKEEALAVLDQKFLSGVANASEPYRKWLEKNAGFTYGTVQDTRRIDTVKGGLGSSDIRVEGNAIVGRINSVNCHCSDFGPACGNLPTTVIDCINKICDLVNCVSAIANGDRSECNQEGATARATCDLAAGVAQ